MQARHYLYLADFHDLFLSPSLLFSLIVDRATSRYRENLKPRGGTLIEEHPSDKHVINTSFVSKLEAPRVSQPFAELPQKML